MASSIAPGYVQLDYTSAGHSHKALLPCAFDGVPTAGLDPDIVKKVGASISSTAAVAAYVAKIKPFFPAAASFDNFYVFYKPTPTDPPTLIYAAALGIAGTGAGSSTVANEAVFTFKTPRPGGLKIYMMETIYTNDLKFPLSIVGSDPENLLAAYMCGNDAWIIGRNNDFPLIPLNGTTKENDHLRRKYLL